MNGSVTILDATLPPLAPQSTLLILFSLKRVLNHHLESAAFGSLSLPPAEPAAVTAIDAMITVYLTDIISFLVATLVLRDWITLLQRFSFDVDYWQNSLHNLAFNYSTLDRNSNKFSEIHV